MALRDWLQKLKIKGPEWSPAFSRLLSYFQYYRRNVAFGIACLLAANIFRLGGPLVIGIAVDNLLAEVTRWKLALDGGIIILFVLVQGVLLFLQRRALVFMARDIEYRMRNDFYEHLQKLGQELSQLHRTGDLMARATSDIGTVRMLFGIGLINTMNALFVMLIILPVMLVISWRLSLVALLPVPLLFITSKVVSKMVHDRSLKVQDFYGTLSSNAQEALAGVRVTRAYRREAAWKETFGELNREYMIRNLSLIRISAILGPLLQFLLGVGSISVFWYGSRLILSQSITIGQFLGFTIYMGYLVGPIIALGNTLTILQRVMASMRRIQSVMAMQPAIRDTADANLELAEIKGAIEFQNLILKYRGQTYPALKRINLRIPQSTTVAIVGPVGSGKSTLMNLVPRLLEADAGRLLIDGHSIREIPLKLLRSSIGYVPQESVLLSGTIRENISFGAADATMEEIERAAAEAEIARDIAEFPQGYETLVGERGVTLSGGQKQRLAIARALLRRPKILILDDAMSSVDAITEKKILMRLRRIMGGCTTLIVTQRIACVKDADFIAVLEDGRMTGCGTHDELLGSNRFYARMYQEQAVTEALTAIY